MLKIDRMDDPRGISILVEAPLTTLDYELAGQRLEAVPEEDWSRLLVEVHSIAVVEPKVMWEDLKVAPLVRHMHAVAVVSEVEWYSRLAELVGAVWPGLEVSHFKPFDRDAALRWLGTYAA